MKCDVKLHEDPAGFAGDVEFSDGGTVSLGRPHEDPPKGVKYNVHHFVKIPEHQPITFPDGSPGIDRSSDYGILEIEEMHEEVKQAITDLKEAHADGGVSTANPEAIADEYRDKTKGLLTVAHGRTVEECERGLRLLDAMDEYFYHPNTPASPTLPDFDVESFKLWDKIKAIMEEHGDDS